MMGRDDILRIVEVLTKHGFNNTETRDDGIHGKMHFVGDPKIIMDRMDEVGAQLQEINENLDAAFSRNGVDKNGVCTVYIHVFTKRKSFPTSRRNERKINNHNRLTRAGTPGLLFAN